MSDLRSFVALQARVFEFLAKQDEATLQGILNGAVHLSVRGADGVSAAPSRPAEDEQRLLQYMPVKELKSLAKARGLRNYSGLNRIGLIELLGGTAPDVPSRPRTPVPSRPAPPVRPNVDVTAIAERLREIESEEEGSTYLHDQRLDRQSLLAVASELQLTRVDKLSQSDLEKRVLKQAIGARRKFTGLRRW